MLRGGMFITAYATRWEPGVRNPRVIWLIVVCNSLEQRYVIEVQIFFDHRRKREILEKKVQISTCLINGGLFDQGYWTYHSATAHCRMEHFGTTSKLALSNHVFRAPSTTPCTISVRQAHPRTSQQAKSHWQCYNLRITEYIDFPLGQTFSRRA